MSKYYILCVSFVRLVCEVSTASYTTESKRGALLALKKPVELFYRNIDLVLVFDFCKSEQLRVRFGG